MSSVSPNEEQEFMKRFEDDRWTQPEFKSMGHPRTHFKIHGYSCPKLLVYPLRPQYFDLKLGNTESLMKKKRVKQLFQPEYDKAIGWFWKLVNAA